MMKRDFVVVKIDAAPDGGPYVLVSFADPRDVREGVQAKFSPQVMGFTSMDDLMKNLQKALSGLSGQMMGRLATTIKMDMREYEDSGLRVGDKVYIEIKKAEREGA